MTIKYYRFTSGLLLLIFFIVSPVIAAQSETSTEEKIVSEKPRIRSLPMTKIKYKIRQKFTEQESQKLRQAMLRYPVYSEEQTMQFAPITMLLSGKSKRLRISQGDWLKTPVSSLPKNDGDLFWLVRPAAVQNSNLPQDKKIFTVIAKAQRKQTVQDSVYMLVTDATAEILDTDYLVAAQDYSDIDYRGQSGLVGRIISPLLISNRYLQAEQLVWVQLDSRSIKNIDFVARGTVLTMHEMIDLKNTTSMTHYNIIKQPAGELVLLHYFPKTQLALGYSLSLNNKRDSNFVVRSRP